MTNKVHEFIGEISKKAGITEIIINGLDNIYVEKDGELIRLDIQLPESDVDAFCEDIAELNKKEFNSFSPVLDGNIADGSRINMIHKDYTNKSHAITIRRYVKSIKTFDSSPNIFGLDEDWMFFFKILVRAKTNIVVAGGTGAGKTTMLNLLLQEVAPKERIITIEDTRELQFKLPNVVRLEARPSVGENKGLTIRDLVKNTLRMRPDRIIVGECRGSEVFDLLQAMNTGHEGSMTSLHANSPAETYMRLENLYLLSGFELPIKALRYQMSSALDFIIQIKRDREGKRIVSQVVEVSNLEGDKILSQDIGVLKDGKLTFTGLVPGCMDKLTKAGLPKDFFTTK